MRRTIQILVFSLFVAAAVTSAKDGKLNFEYCTTEAECAPPRHCLTTSYYGDVVPCGGPGQVCMCISFPTLPCDSSSPCDDGEQCAKASFIPFATCMSCVTSISVTSAVEGDTSCSHDDTSRMLLRPTIPIGLTGDFCKENGQFTPCFGARTCGSMLHGQYSTCSDDLDYCYCIPHKIPPCDSSAICMMGERCVRHELANNATMCVSCAAEGNFDFFVPTDDGSSCSNY